MTNTPNSKFGKFHAWLLVFAVVNLLWLVSFGIIHTDAMGRQESGYEWGIPLINELTGTYSAFFLIPFLYLLWLKYPLTRPNWLKHLPLYIGVTILIGVMHTSLMLVSREILYPLFGFGDHDPGRLIFRYAMEFQKQVFWIWGTFGILALIRHLRTYHESRIRSAKLQEQLVQSRLDVMRQQINPHFLFNSLNLISSKVYESAEEADQLITDLADLLRASLEMGRQSTVPLARELNFLDKYVHIMKARFGDRFLLTKKIDPACLNVAMPSLILQPIIENSFKHRLEADSAELKIDLIVQPSDGHMHIQILDESTSSIHYPRDQSSAESKGVGLGNVRARLETMYADDASFSYGTKGDKQFEVIIKLPLQSNPDG